MDPFEKVIEYRAQDRDIQVIELDSKELVIACIAFGAIPIRSVSNGTKSKVYFYKDEAEEPIRKVQLFLAGVNTELKVDYIAILRAENLWRGLMSLQNQIKMGNRHSGN